MWATQPLLTAALNKEFRTKKQPDSYRDLYAQVVVRARSADPDPDPDSDPMTRVLVRPMNGCEPQ